MNEKDKLIYEIQILFSPFLMRDNDLSMLRDMVIKRIRESGLV